MRLRLIRSDSGTATSWRAFSDMSISAPLLRGAELSSFAQNERDVVLACAG
jgi:hypothetical protein